MKYELSVVIPSRNEMFLSRTIQDILEHIEGNTEIIAVLDGKWADPVIPQHERVTVVYHAESIGQRAACNEASKLAAGKYIMKCDAHCSFEQGFDVKLMADMQDNWTVVPTMRNLHAFDWKCKKCGLRTYQGPTITKCTNCGCEDKDNFYRRMVWKAKTNPQSNSYCFDSEPHFQYDNSRKNTEEYKKGIIVGYKLWVDSNFISSDLLVCGSPLTLGRSQPSSFAGVVNLLTNFANSHHFSGSANPFGFGKNVSVNTVGLSFINSGGSVGISDIDTIGDKSQMEGITTSPIFTNMVNNQNIFSSTHWNFSDEPSIEQAVCKYTLSEVGTVSITSFIGSSDPVPTTRRVINSNLINELNDIIGGEFVYNEKTDRFHNGSVALTPVYDKDLTETMSLQGSCFMLTKDKWFELNICDEEFGSWGSQGIEVAVKTWLSGGRVMVNHKTYYAHLFRTQGGDFSFPYHMPQKQADNAKKKARELFLNNKWEKQIHPVSWLVRKFSPVPGWTEEELKKLEEKSWQPM